MIISSRSVRCSKPRSLGTLTAYPSHTLLHIEEFPKSTCHTYYQLPVGSKVIEMHTRRTLRMHTPRTYLLVALLSVSSSLMSADSCLKHGASCLPLYSVDAHTYNPFHLCRHTVVSKVKSHCAAVFLICESCYYQQLYILVWTLHVQMYRTTGGVIGANNFHEWKEGDLDHVDMIGLIYVCMKIW